MKAYAPPQKLSDPERDRIIARHVEIARRISLHMARRCPAWIAREDLVAAAMLGLTEAAERYDSNRNEPFLAFAEKRIRGAVLDELRRGDILPRRVRQLARKVGRTIADLETQLGTCPPDEAVAAALGVTVEDYRANLEQLVHVTIGALDMGEHATDLVATEVSPSNGAIRSEALHKVRQALPHLGARELVLLDLYYNDELTYQEIGEVLGVTSSRVCQLHGHAVARLRAELGVQVEPT